MALHAVNHILSTCRVAARSGTAWEGEVALTGFRWGVVAPANSVPGFSDGQITLGSFDVNDAATSGTTTNLNKVQGWAGNSSPTGPDVTDGDQDGIAEAVFAFITAWSDIMPNDFEFQDIRLYPIVGTTGKTATAPCIYTPKTPLYGNRTDAWIPQAALALSFRTNARGRVGHGKAFLGPVSSGTSVLTDAGLVSSYASSLVVGAGVTLQESVRAIGSIASSRYYGMVWRRKSDQGSVIKSVACGDEMDTQQRRRRQRAEVYTSTDLT